MTTTVPFARTKDGFELQLATNVLVHYVLANRLSVLMRQGARLVVVSSNSHRFADVDLDDLNVERGEYEPWLAYSRSETGDALLAVAFDQRYRSGGIPATSVHPGIISTDLTRDQDPKEMQKMLDAMRAQDAAHGLPRFEVRSIPQGAATSVWAGIVADADVVGGLYCEDCAVAEPLADDAYVSALWGGVRAYALDAGHAEAFWEKIGELTGERY